jgi:proteic killer suppression protein
MDVSFRDDELERLDREASFTAKLAPGVVKAFRKRMQTIKAASDERDFYAFKSLHYEQMKSNPKQHSMRLNDQYRLIIELEEGSGTKAVVVVRIEDYH